MACLWYGTTFAPYTGQGCQMAREGQQSTQAPPAGLRHGGV